MKLQRKALGRGIGEYLQRNGIDLTPEPLIRIVKRTDKDPLTVRRPRPLHVNECRETGFSTGITCYTSRNWLMAYLAMEATHDGVTVNPVDLGKLWDRLGKLVKIGERYERLYRDR